MNSELLLAHYERIAEAPDAIARLRRFILDLAVRGKLVEQDLSDEPISVLLKRIAAETGRLIAPEFERENHKFASPSIDVIDIPDHWIIARLDQLSAKIHYGFTASADHSAEDTRLLRITDIQDDKVQWENVPGCIIGDDIAENFLLKDGDLLIARTGGTIGKTFLVQELPVRAVFASYLIRVQPVKSIDCSYIKLFCGSQLYWQQLLSGARGGAQPNVNGKTLGALRVPLPPVAEQQRIVAKVDELMALCDQLEAAHKECEGQCKTFTLSTFAKLDEPDPQTFASDSCFALEHFEPLTKRTDQIKQLRQTILNLAVRGKLVEQDPNDELASELLKRIAAEKARAGRQGTRGNAVDDVHPAVPPFCVPGGWVWCGATYPAQMISDVGRKVQTKDVLPAGKHPVVDQGKVFIRGYCNDDNKLIEVKGAVIVFGDHTRETKLIDFPFVVGADGVKILEPIEISPRFYHLCLTWLPLDSRGYGRHFKLLRQSYIPLPPLAEQHRIVAKVDELLALCDQLEASLIEGEQTRSKLLEAVLHEALEPIKIT